MQKLKHAPYFLAVMILAYMPFHIFLSQWLSTYTGGLEAWKIGKDVVLLAASLFAICLVSWQGKAGRVFKVLLSFTVVYAALHLVIWAFNPGIFRESAILGVTYNVRLPLFALLGYSAVCLLPKFAFSSVLKITILISTVVAVFGIVQYFLPPDFLQHFGYSLERGTRPAFFIDDNPAYPRIMSTLREPNALGAFLILPATVLAIWAVRPAVKKRWLAAGLFLLHAAAILLTFSRSAWLGFTFALLFALGWQFKDQVYRLLKRFWPMLLVGVLACGVLLFGIKDSHFYQHYIVHSDPTEQVQDLDSNDYHSLLVREGLAGIQAEPLGHGPGTAGIVSIRNPDSGQLTENYYLQIAYETGIAGALLFIAFNIWLYVRLWRRHDVYGLVLCASFWAYVITNMLLHSWSNEAVAGQWWILAGMALVVGTDGEKTSSSVKARLFKRRSHD